MQKSINTSNNFRFEIIYRSVNFPQSFQSVKTEGKCALNGAKLLISESILRLFEKMVWGSVQIVT